MPFEVTARITTRRCPASAAQGVVARGRSGLLSRVTTDWNVESPAWTVASFALCVLGKWQRIRAVTLMMGLTARRYSALAMGISAYNDSGHRADATGTPRSVVTPEG